MTTTPASTRTASTTRTMRAAVQRAYTSVDHISIESVDRPTPAANEVLLDVRAAGVDRGVWHLATGRPFIMRGMGFGLRRPSQPIQGTDVAGVVAAVGSEVTRFKVGDAVMGSANGSFAEQAVAKEGALARVPEGLPLTEAAAVAVSGITAQTAVMRLGAVEAGQRVLVLGASGGVGSFAVQLAAHAGAEVTGVCSGAKAGFVMTLGATRTIDYATTDVTSLDEQFDLIIDIGGLTPVRRLRRVLSPAGRLVIVGGEGGGSVAGGIGRQLRATVASLFTRQKLMFFMSVTKAPALEELSARIARGEIRPAVTATYPLDRAADAVVDLVAGRISGKAVVTTGAGR